MYKLLPDVLAALATRIGDDKLKKVRKGNQPEQTYIKWTDSAEQLDAIFGVDGWEESIEDFKFDATKGVYAVVRTIRGFVQEVDDTGRPTRTSAITRTAVGRAVAVGDNHDTAIAAADSDSFSRAAKKFGDALGLFLYDKDDVANQPTGTVAAAPRSTPLAPQADPNKPYGPKGPTVSQARVLTTYLGYTEAELANTPYETWKASLDNRTPNRAS